MFRRPATPVVPNLKAAFDSVNRAALWRCLTLNVVSEKFITLIQSPYANSQGRVRAYGDVTPGFTAEIGVTEMLIKVALPACENSTGICLTWNMRTTLCH